MRSLVFLSVVALSLIVPSSKCEAGQCTQSGCHQTRPAVHRSVQQVCHRRGKFARRQPVRNVGRAVAGIVRGTGRFLFGHRRRCY